MEYIDFLKGKIETAPVSGFDVPPEVLCGKLNDGYFRDAVGYLKAEEEEMEIPTLFDFVEGI